MNKRLRKKAKRKKVFNRRKYTCSLSTPVVRYFFADETEHIPKEGFKEQVTPWSSIRLLRTP
ncbi:MAG: hypothetical protein NE330_15130 [Lentisphaeraceae bacterium]|nr:hypothetical protein [Lentisphaeraceae bacterium]